MHSLVLQSYGGEIQYRRAILIILSFYAVTDKSTIPFKISLYTDNIPYFKGFLKNIQIRYVYLDADKISQMKGRQQFIHRIKIGIIEEVLNQTDGYLIYADSDCFFLKDPTPYMKYLNHDISYMHKNEYHFSDLKNHPLPSGEESLKFYNAIVNKTFLLTGNKSISVTEHHSSWNAGMIILHRKHLSLLPDIYSLTDTFYDLSGNHASEQFAFSVILQTLTELKPCSDLCYHYWPRIEKEIVDKFLIRLLREKIKFAAKEEITHVVIPLIKKLPSYIKHHKLMIQDHAIQAFHAGDFRSGCMYSISAFLKDPFAFGFLHEVLYHIKNKIYGK